MAKTHPLPHPLQTAGTGGRSRSLLVNCSLLALSTLVGLLVAETFLRYAVFGWNGFSIAGMNSTHPIGNSGMIQASPHQEILWELKPDIDVLFRFTRLRTNHDGLRDRDYPQAKPENTYRIAVIGDSFTMGSGVELDETYHSLLENRLNRESAGARFELINFGVGGYSVRQYAAVMKYKALQYHPDLVLIGFCGMNDSWQETPEGRFHQPFVPRAATYPFFRPLLWDQLRASLARLLPREKKALDHPYLQRFFSEIGVLSRRSKVPVLVVYLSLEPRDFRPVQRVAEENGLRFQDASYPFRGKDLSDYIIYRIDPHPSARGHLLFADAIYDCLISAPELGIAPLLVRAGPR